MKIKGTYAADIFFGQSWDDQRLKLPANMSSNQHIFYMGGRDQDEKKLTKCHFFLK